MKGNDDIKIKSRKPVDRVAITKIIAIILAIAAGITLVVFECIPVETETKQAVYKGYIVAHRSMRYPIVELDGIEYKSNCNQPVRDNSYINQPVTIVYEKGNIKSFRIQW